ncbi:hypothetical protein B4077_3001 [Bacillus cereus]|uniref:Uncharacterized protein n=1 Tax=Bacillus cereus TaxID=1396 RepID=A0A0G8F5I8_BACCE|nr:hypothetical protein B4077_3001 [Bacillus cereus]
MEFSDGVFSFSFFVVNIVFIFLISLYCFKVMKNPEIIKRKETVVSESIISNIK